MVPNFQNYSHIILSFDWLGTRNFKFVKMSKPDFLEAKLISLGCEGGRAMRALPWTTSILLHLTTGDPLIVYNNYNIWQLVALICHFKRDKSQIIDRLLILIFIDLSGTTARQHWGRSARWCSLGSTLWTDSGTPLTVTAPRCTEFVRLCRCNTVNNKIRSTFNSISKSKEKMLDQLNSSLNQPQVKSKGFDAQDCQQVS